MTETLHLNSRTISLPTGLFINGQFVNSKQGAKFDVEDPATGQPLISIVEGREDDVDEAVRVARQVFDAGDWAQSNPTYRASLLNKLADLFEENKDDLIALECADTGKTLKLCSSLDFPASVGTLRYYAGWADKVAGETSFNIPGTFAYTRREPIGVCGQIIPWNFPLMMFIWKIAPALATGNTVVIKSAEATPLSALKACELISKAGFPPGTLNLVSGYGKTVGSAIAHHMDVDKVAFTGSTTTGRAILRASAASNLKKVTLELGGKSPNIIFPDADVDKAVDWSAWGINMNYGQTCHAGTRIYIHEDIYDTFLTKFTARLKEIIIGHPFDKTTKQGPQNSKMQYEKILGYIDSGVEEGATLHLGGKAIEKETGGYYIEPTIFTDVRPEMKIMREEIFGPVVAISKFSSEAEVIKHANDTSYGLAAACHTKDYERAIRVTNALRAGTTWVNMYNFVHWSIPFGGFKESGIGRECGAAVLENYTQTKAVFFNMGVPCPE
ncbi:aldehyde dehydrogenase family protein [Aspergillus ruber CBS 135680]|uniref:aldehyde dehydrogenase (NAD(+)) n=1 Tax=Aspergillus ruber (strain CBS 135680) TaxID=1388766 RepID=A0A017SPX3_ASPRC|nr:aldehyde dehydrogenase [Aspergillus ruber CBS 135680]EYE99018.1 aldehyde dehydrogenase [Aspergillus ruber CBS 135680]